MWTIPLKFGINPLSPLEVVVQKDLSCISLLLTREGRIKLHRSCISRDYKEYIIENMGSICEAFFKQPSRQDIWWLKFSTLSTFLVCSWLCCVKKWTHTHRSISLFLTWSCEIMNQILSQHRVFKHLNYNGKKLKDLKVKQS